MHQLHFKGGGSKPEGPSGSRRHRCRKPELKIARQLIDQLGAKRFDPNEFG